MVDLRSSIRSKTGAGASVQKAAGTQASSSSVRASRAFQSDENAPLGRRALGDIKNVVADRKPAAVEVSTSRRKPLTDRNANLQSDLFLSSVKAKSTKSSKQALKSTAGLSNRSKTIRPEIKTRSATASKAAASAPHREAHLPTPLPLQTKSADRAPRPMPPSDEELSRLSPNLDSDDLGYFDVDILESNQTEHVAQRQGKRDPSPRSKDDSDTDASASHGSSDKENVPPSAAAASKGDGFRQAGRGRTGVLSEIEDGQPTHSTPVSQKRKGTKTQAFSSKYLDENFLDKSDNSSQADSPGVPRRAEPLSDSTKQLQDYQDQGVTKVMAWKAEGHHQAHQSPDDLSLEGEDDRAASWPTDDDLGPSAAEQGLGMDDDFMDDFGFLVADRNIRLRQAQALAAEEEGGDLDEGDATDVMEDLPSDPPVNTTSDDRRLAEQVFARMSSPAAGQGDRRSTTTESSSIAYMGAQRVDLPPPSEGESEEQEDLDVKVKAELPTQRRKTAAVKAEITSERRMTRASAKRKSDAAAAAEDNGSRESSPMLTPPPAHSTRQAAARAAMSRQSLTGIPLKRSEKKEQAMLQRLAAEAASSSVYSSAPPSPQNRGSSKRIRMEDIVAMLPGRKRLAKASARKAKATSRVSHSNASGRSAKAKAPASKDDSDEDFDQVPTSKSTKRSPAPKPKKGKSRAQLKSTDETEDWRNLVHSSQIHSDDSETTKRRKEYLAAENYSLEVETVL